MPAAAWVALYVMGLAGALASIAVGALASLALFLATSASVVVALERLRIQQGAAPTPRSLWWAPFVGMALIPWWFARARFAKAIEWRGRSYDLDPAGRLGVCEPQIRCRTAT